MTGARSVGRTVWQRRPLPIMDIIIIIAFLVCNHLQPSSSTTPPPPRPPPSTIIQRKSLCFPGPSWHYWPKDNRRSQMVDTVQRARSARPLPEKYQDNQRISGRWMGEWNGWNGLRRVRRVRRAAVFFPVRAVLPVFTLVIINYFYVIYGNVRP